MILKIDFYPSFYKRFGLFSKLFLPLLAIYFFCSNSITQAQSSAYDYSLPSKQAGDSIRLRDFKGKKILIVNIASRCGYTKQLAALERLAQKYAHSLVVIGVPSNDFLQTPENDAGIVDFCQKNYGVTFPVSSVVHIKGENCEPLFGFLTQKRLNGRGDFQVSWNFNKFLLDENGVLLAHFDSKVKPEDEALSSYLR